MRLHIFYTSATTTSGIQSVCSLFRATRVRWFELSHSSAVKPVHIGYLTGSVKTMAPSQAFHDVFKKKFGLSELGLWFTQPRSHKFGDYNKAKHILHIEIDRDDIHKRPSIETFFNSAKSTLSVFFGVPMILTPAYDYFAEDDVKSSLDNHSRKQTSLGKSLRCTTISGVRMNNWANSAKTSTLLQSLMAVESITDKKVLNAKSAKVFKGRLFTQSFPIKRTSLLPSTTPVPIMLKVVVSQEVFNYL